MSGRLINEIGRLANLDLSGLRRRWFDIYESRAPVHMSRELLIQAIAYRLQENAHGGLTPSERAKLLARTGGGQSSRSKIDRSVKPGTRFIREWQGRTVEVTASEGHFLYRGRTYGSLSAIAREITGTRWSGPAFFGIGPRKESGHGSA